MPPEKKADGGDWPLVSVVVPSLDQGAFLEAALRSALLQDYPRLEVIVIDGGSTDDSVAILQKYDAWLTAWISSADRGPAHALNKGFGMARGDILATLNADDFLLPGSLRAVAQAFADDETADVIAGHGYLATRAGALGPAIFSDGWNPTRFAYGACVLLQPATFVRRESFVRAHGFRETGRVCWDMELWADLARSGARFRLVEAFLAAHRIHAASISGGIRHVRARRDDARAVMAEFRGRPERRTDRLWHGLYRLAKFGRHPARALRQRAFFRANLGRWTP